jgi:hypothetical protein
LRSIVALNGISGFGTFLPGEPLTNPTTGIAGCCARAVSGHATVAPPSSVAKNFRRPM